MTGRQHLPGRRLARCLIAICLPLLQSCAEKDPLPAQTEILDSRVVAVKHKLAVLARDSQTHTVYGAAGPRLYRIVANGDRLDQVAELPEPVTAIHFARSGWFLATDRNPKDPKTPCRIYRSTDNGGSFQQIWQMQNSCALNWSIASDNKGHVYIGEYGPSDIGMSKQVWKSIDGGDSWQVAFRAPNREGLHIHRVAVDPFSNDVWVTVGDGRENRGAYRSRDAGASWQRLLDTQATGIAFAEDAVYFGEDHKKRGRVSRYERKSGKYREIFRASDHGNYGGSVYALGLTSDGSLIVPTMKYGGQDHIASLWIGAQDSWLPLLRLQSRHGIGTGLASLAGPDGDGWWYVKGFKIKDRLKEQ